MRRVSAADLAAGDLVFAEHLQEFQVPEVAVAGLGQSGIEGVEHAGEFEGAQRVAQRGVEDAHDSDLLRSDRMVG